MKEIKTIWLLIGLLFSYSIQSWSQTPEWTWAIQANSPATDAGRGVSVDKKAGDIYWGGVIGGVCTELGLTSTGSTDAFLAKQSPNGALRWAFKIGGITADQIASVWADSTNQRVYVCGNYSGTATFNGVSGPIVSRTAALGMDVFVACYDSAGALVWLDTLGGNNDQEPFRVHGDDNFLYVGGYFVGDIRYEIGGSPIIRPSQGMEDFFVCQINKATGAINWMASPATGNNNERAYGISSDMAGGVYITGYYDSPDFTLLNLLSITIPILNIGAPGDRDIFVVKLRETDGRMIWQNSAGDPGFNDAGRDIAFTSGGLMLTGGSNNLSRFPPLGNVASGGGLDCFLANMDPATGNFSWARTFGLNQVATLDEGLGLDVDEFENVYITGLFSDTIAFPSRLTPTFKFNLPLSSPDIFVASFQTNGNFRWARVAGQNPSNEQSADISVHNSTASYLTGFYQIGSALVQTIPPTTLTLEGASDGYLAKLSVIPIGVGKDSLCLVAGTLDSINVLLDDTLHLGIATSFSIVTPPTIGFATANEPFIRYTSPVAFAADSLEYQICDTFGQCATGWVYFGMIPQANAGNDTLLCGATPITLRGNNPLILPSIWTVASGSAIFGNPFQYNTTANGFSVGANALAWTINGPGCSSSDTVIITVATPPSVNLGNDTTICNGSALSLNAGNPGSTYLWSTGATSQTISVFFAGNYQVTVTDGNGCQGTDQINVSVQANPPVNLGNDTTLCAGNSIQLDALNFGAAYLWSTGATSQTITVSTAGNFQVTVTDPMGCQGTDQINIAIQPLPVVNLGNDTTLCTSQTLALDAGNPGATYLWSTGATSQTIVVVTAGLYQVTVTDAIGCQGSDQINVSNFPVPSVNLGPDTTICAGNTVLLDAGAGFSNYQWNTGPTTQTLLVNATGLYAVTVIDGNGCQGGDMINITIAPNPIVNLGNDTTLCAGDTIRLDAGNPGGSYLWNIGANSQAIPAFTAGVYYVDVTDFNGCIGSDTLVLSYFPQINVNLGNDTTVCVGQSIILDAGNAGSTFLWNTGATSQTISTSTPGTYYVDVTDGNGCQGSDTLVFTNFPALVLNLGNDTTACIGQSVTLDAGNTGSTFLWNTGATSQTITISTPGTYYVDVTDGNGCQGSDTLVLSNFPALVVNLGNDTTVCIGQSVLLDAGNTGSTFLWNTGATSQTISTSTPGTFYVDVTDGNGCQGSDTLILSNFPALVLNLGNDTTVCVGQSITLDAGNVGSTYLWNTGATSQTISTSIPGTYYVDVTDGNGCQSSDTLILSNFPALVVNLGNDTTVCIGQSVTLDAGSPGSTFLWNTGATSQTITATTQGTYYVDVTDGNGCQGSDTLILSNFPALVVNLGNDTTVCIGQSVLLDAGNAGSTFLWNTGATSQTISTSTPGTYYVDVTDGNGCQGSDTLFLSNFPALVVNLGNDTTVCVGQSIILDAGNAGSTYLWNTGATSQTISTSTPGTYYVDVTDGNGCQNSDTLVFSNSPVLAVNLGNDTTVCIGHSIILDAGNPGSTFLWNTGATSQTIAATTQGTYYVDVTDGNGCQGSDTLVLSNFPALVVNLGNDTAVCVGQSIILDAGNAGSTYLWNTGATSQIITTSTSGSYYVNMTDGNGCLGSDTLIFSNFPALVVNLGNDTTVCIGQSVTLDAGNTGSTFLWNTGATSQTISTSTPGTYYVDVTDGNGCTGSDTLLLSNSPALVVNLGNDTTVCIGQSVTLDAGNAGSTHAWNTGAVSQSISASTAGTFYVDVTDGNGCSASDTILLSNFTPVLVSLGNDTTVCTGDSITLDAGNPFGSFLWNTGATTQSITIGSPGTYYVDVTDTNGCLGSDTLFFSVFSPVLVNLGNDTTLCQGDTLMVDAGNIGGSFSWNTGDISQQIRITSAGTFSVTVTDGNGCQGLDSIQIQFLSTSQFSIGNDTTLCTGDSLLLDAGPGANFYAWSNGQTSRTIWANSTGIYSVTVSNGVCVVSDTLILSFSGFPTVNLGADTTICAGDSLNLDAGNAGSTYIWNTGSITQQIWVNATGSYSVTVTNPFGCSGSDTLSLTVSPLPNPSLGNDTILCIGQSITLQAPAGASNYLWSTGSTATSIIVSSSGNYAVTVQNAIGCTASDTISVVFDSLPVVSLGPDTLLCAGDSILLDAGNTGSAYAWSNGNSSQSISVTSAGNYSVTVTNSSGCQSADTVFVDFAPPFIISLGNDTLLCENDSIQLQPVGAFVSYAWSNGSTSAQINAGWGTWSLTVTNALGCSATDTIIIGQRGITQVDLGNPIVMCAGDSAQIVPSGNGTSFLWSTGEMTSTIWVMQPGQYSVQATATGLCPSGDSVMVTTVGPTPLADAGIDISLRDQLSFQLSGNDPLPGSGIWTLASGIGASINTPTDSNSVVLLPANGAYAFIWTISLAPCPDSYDTVWVFAEGLFIPTGYSPNGDGVNDFFVVPGIQQFSLRSLQVFNRWGNLVYQDPDYNNNWNGTNTGGNALTDDTYYFILNLGTREAKGYVVIKR